MTGREELGTVKTLVKSVAPRRAPVIRKRDLRSTGVPAGPSRYAQLLMVTGGRKRAWRAGLRANSAWTLPAGGSRSMGGKYRAGDDLFRETRRTK